VCDYCLSIEATPRDYPRAALDPQATDQMGTWAKGLEDGQRSGRTGKAAGGWAKKLEDGQSSGRMGQEHGRMGQDVGGWAKTWEDGPRRGRTGQDTGKARRTGQGKRGGQCNGWARTSRGTARWSAGTWAKSGPQGHSKRPQAITICPQDEKENEATGWATRRMSPRCPRDILEAPGSPP